MIGADTSNTYTITLPLTYESYYIPLSVAITAKTVSNAAAKGFGVVEITNLSSFKVYGWQHPWICIGY